MANLRNDIRDEMLETYFLGSTTVALVLYTVMPTIVFGEDGTELADTGYAPQVATWVTDGFGKVKLAADVTFGPNSSGVDWTEIKGFGILSDGIPGGVSPSQRLVTFADIYGGVIVPDGTPLMFKAGIITVSQA